MVIDVSQKEEHNNSPLDLPIVIDLLNFLNSATRYGVWFDNGIRVEAVGNTPSITYMTKRSSSP